MPDDTHETETETETVAEAYDRVATAYDEVGNRTSFWEEVAERYYARLLRRLDPSAPLQIVDVGCGTGNGLRRLLQEDRPSWRLIGVEPSRGMRDAARARLHGFSNVEILDGSFEHLPLADASADVIVSMWAFHWCQDAARGLSEARRVLRPRGLLDMHFVGNETGRGFTEALSRAITSVGGRGAAGGAASSLLALTRAELDALLASSLPHAVVEEEKERHYASAAAHLQWFSRMESQLSAVGTPARAALDAEIGRELELLNDGGGVPYDRHSFHVSFDGTLHVAADEVPASLIRVSADTVSGLRWRAASHIAQLRRHLRVDVREVAAALDDDRGAARERLGVAGRTRSELIRGLEAFLRDEPRDHVVVGRPLEAVPKVVFLFPGRGSRDIELDETLATRLPSSRLDVPLPSAADPTSDRVLGGHIELLTTALRLSSLLRAWGITPWASLGHSLGEYAAAACAGVLSTADVVAAVRDRATRMDALPADGAMVAVFATPESVSDAARGLPGIAIAAYNSRENTVVSGGIGECHRLATRLDDQGIPWRWLDVPLAFHSDRMRPIVEGHVATMRTMPHRAPRSVLFSTVTGGALSSVSPDHWGALALEPVRFVDAVRAARSRGADLFVELGRRPMLSRWSSEQEVPAEACRMALTGEGAADTALMATLGWLWCRGVGATAAAPCARASLRPVEARDVDRVLEARGRVRDTPPGIERLVEAEGGNVLTAARRIVLEVVEAVLGRAVDGCDPTRGLMELGLDSLQVVAVARQLRSRLGRPVPTTLVFEAATVRDLTAWVHRRLAEHEPAELHESGPAIRAAQDEPIAIVGAGLRFPSGIDSLGALWAFLSAEGDAVRAVPSERLDLWEGRSGRALPDFPRYGAFVDDVDLFDAGHFHISPREAAALDPAYRILLECCWEALEDAGQSPEALHGTRTGVYVGVGPSEYPAGAAAGAAQAYTGLGRMPSVAVGRIAHAFGLRGPAMAIDTACSSSLVALHAAVAALRRGECDAALVGGASLQLDPRTNAWLWRSGALAADGRCRTFSGTAGGYGRSEGCGVILLRPLSESERRRDRILALVRGTATNHDGRSAGLTAPSELAQVQVLRAALQDARVDASEVSYVEAHGTGTILGDPIEVSALSRVYASADRTLRIGSVKPNLGHLEYAAGIAGVMKVIACLDHDRLPASKHAAPLNPHIDFGDAIRVVTDTSPWSRGSSPRRAGVSSFGMSGTNAHVILEEAPRPARRQPEEARPRHLLVLSARSEEALDEQRRRLEAHLSGVDPTSLADVCYTLATGRTHFEHRLALVCGDGAPSWHLAAMGRAGDADVAFALSTEPAGAAEVELLRTSSPDFLASYVQGREQGLPDRVAITRALFLLLGTWGVRPQRIAAADDEAEALLAELAELSGAAIVSLERCQEASAVVWVGGGSSRLGNRPGRTACRWLPTVVAGTSPWTTLLWALGQLWATGTVVDWEALDAPYPRRRVQLPTYAFRRQSFWVESPTDEASNDGFGLDAVDIDHAFLRTASRLPDGGWLFAGSIDLDEHAWLGDHVVHGAVVLPGLATADLCLACADHIGAKGISTLVLRSPIHFSETIRSRQVQIQVSRDGGTSTRRLTIRTRPRTVTEEGWSVHGTATLVSAPSSTALQPLPRWPPSGRPALEDRTDPYRKLRARGLAYGPALQCLKGAWVDPSTPDALWVEVCLPLGVEGESARARTGAHRLHPVLGDALLHAVALLAPEDEDTRLPVEFSGICRLGAGGRCLRAHLALARHADHTEIHISAWDDRGHPVARVEGLRLDPVDARRLLRSIAATASGPHLYRLQAVSMEGPDAEHVGALERLDLHTLATARSPHVLLDLRRHGQSAAALCGRLLSFLQARVDPSRLLESLTVVTRGAVGVTDEEPADIAAACAWGLLRAVRSEHPGAKICLIDADEHPESDARVQGRSAPTSHAELQVRRGEVCRLQLVRVVDALAPEAARVAARDHGTALITGGLGALGRAVAQHLVTTHGYRHLLLLSRGSHDAEALVGALHDAGALTVDLVRCDVRDRRALTRALAAVPADRPLDAVFHTAGVLRDAPLAGQSSEALAEVFAPKLDAARLLDELTSSIPTVEHFVLFSSAAGVLGMPGQCNYAAANAGLDALARRRRSKGLPATSLAWGPWSVGMTERLSRADERRLARQGLRPLSVPQGLALLDAALSRSSPAVLVPMLADAGSSVFQTEGRSPLLDTGEAASGHPRAQELDALAGPDPVSRLDAALLFVRQQVARMLGGSVERIEPDVLLGEISFDSLLSVDLRNEVSRRLGVDLPADGLGHEATPRSIATLLLEAIPNSELPAAAPPLAARSEGARPAASTLPDASPLQRAIGEAIEELAIAHPYTSVHDGVARDTIQRGTQQLVNFSSYNYLGLSGDSRVQAQVHRAISTYGTSVSASRLASGERPFHRQLEEELAAAQGAEAALVFTSGHATNVTTIGHLLGPHDFVVYDELIHDSVLQGIKLSGAGKRPFPHNDPEALDTILAELRPRHANVLVVIEGVYSVDGDIADLPGFLDVKERHGCLLMVDEAHSFGVLGPTGRGVAEHFGADPRRVDLWMGTVSKTLASCGGWIAGSRSLIEYLRFSAPGFVYSAGMTPANGVAALASLRLMLEEPWRVAKLQANGRHFFEALQQLDLATGLARGRSAVVPVITGDSTHALLLSDRLADQGINVQPMIYPVVPQDSARLRFFLSSAHSFDQLERAAERIAATYRTIQADHPAPPGGP